MSMEAVVEYLNYRLKLSQEDILYKAIVAENIAMIASGRRTEKLISFLEERKKIYGEQNKEEEEEDTRTAQEIIDDTCKKHGIKVIKGV